MRKRASCCFAIPPPWRINAMMDLPRTYLCIGGEPPPACFPSCAFPGWVQTGAIKELPLVGQLSLQPVDNVYPFLPLNGMIQLKDQACPDTDDNMSSDEDTIAYNAIELPLLWGHTTQDHAQHHQCMDGTIWSNLPHDLIEKIIAFLHVPDAVRLCVISKQWNSITCSPNFLKAFAESYNGGSSALMFQCDSMKNKLQTPWLAVYDTIDSKWYSMTLNFLPTPPTVPFMNYTVVSASGGLLCLWPEPQRSSKSVGFIVCNPVTRNWKELPCRSQDNRIPDLVAMYVDYARCCYKVLVILRSHAAVTTELYDSRSCKWKLTGTETSSGGKFKSTVVSGGKVFFVYAKTPQWFKIKVYDMEEQQWRSSISLPAIFYETPEEFGIPEVLDCNGHLLLVGRLGKHSSKEEVVIWELDPSVNGIDSWREVDRMPQDIAREFLGCLVFGHYYCISRGDQIFFIASFKAPMLVYDVLKRAWSWWAWPFYEKYASRFPVFGFVKAPVTFPPFGFAFNLHFNILV